MICAVRPDYQCYPPSTSSSISWHISTYLIASHSKPLSRRGLHCFSNAAVEPILSAPLLAGSLSSAGFICGHADRLSDELHGVGNGRIAKIGFTSEGVEGSERLDVERVVC